MTTTAVKERPILFSAPMVRAILDGSKTQTRRVVKPQPVFGLPGGGTISKAWFWRKRNGVFQSGLPPISTCPYGSVGDRLWVREVFKILIHESGYNNGLQESGDLDWGDGAAEVFYPADNATKIFNELEEKDDEQASRMLLKTKPSIHMPRWASRINLVITNISVERLQDIDDRKSGLEGVRHMPYKGKYCDSGRVIFQQFWETLNGKGSWNANPWVWVIEFRRVS